jgi:hypothetical protein
MLTRKENHTQPNVNACLRFQLRACVTNNGTADPACLSGTGLVLPRSGGLVAEEPARKVTRCNLHDFSWRLPLHDNPVAVVLSSDQVKVEMRRTESLKMTTFSGEVHYLRSRAAPASDHDPPTPPRNTMPLDLIAQVRFPLPRGRE